MIRHSVTGARARRGRPLRFEPLEDRRVLAVVVVDTLEDVVDLGDGKTSLREAIFATNIVPGADEIRFDPALFAAGPATLRLTQGELVISDSLTITGPGPQWLTIDASGSDPTPDIKNGDGGRVFRITDGSTSLLDVAIEGLQLTGGDVAPTTAKVGGGAILNYENLTLAHVVIADNRALAGGGVYHREGSLTVAHSTFVRNAATDRGGGLFAFGVPASQISVSHSEFSDNSATRGGGASISGGTVLLEQLLVDNNLATFAGGGISCEITSLTVLGGTFSNNRAGIRSTGTGGALAISIDPVSSPGTQAILVGVTIRDNMAGDPGFASGFGGGLFFTELRPGPVSQVTALEIRSSTIVGNRANIGGGGIYATGGRAVQISDSTISGNFAVSPTGGQTGGGGGLFLQVAEATMHRVTIAGNESSASGGGIRAAGGVIRIADSIILGNAALAAFANGGGASLSVTAGTLERTVVANNHAGRVGGGLALSYVQLVPGVSIQAFSVLHSVIADNSAVQSGGGIAAIGVLIDSTIVSGNRAGHATSPAGRGGGLSLETESPLDSVIRNSLFIGNSATGTGGAITSSPRLSEIVNTTISGNLAASGGGIWATRLGPVTLRHSTVTGNMATTGVGGVYSNVLLDHSIVAGNHSPLATNADVQTYHANSRHSLIGYTGFSPPGLPPVDGGPDANGNLVGGPGRGAVDPRLGPLADNGGPTLTHALLPGSPAIGAGDPALAPGHNGVPEFDQRGAPFTRLAGARIDIGAYELQPDGGTLNADFDFNGLVDGGDFLLWQRNLGRTAGATLRHGDATADGDVDLHDLAVWRARFLPTTAPATLGPAHSLAAPLPAATPDWVSAAQQAAALGAWDETQIGGGKAGAAQRPVRQPYAPPRGLAACAVIPSTSSVTRPSSADDSDKPRAAADDDWPAAMEDALAAE